jgi:hypothetical protein
MLQKIEQPFTDDEILDSIKCVKVQIEDLILYAKSKFSVAPTDCLYVEAETLLRTELSDLFVDSLIDHLDTLINMRDALSQSIQSYMVQLNARLAKINKSVNAYIHVSRSREVDSTKGETVNTEKEETTATKEETAVSKQRKKSS